MIYAHVCRLNLGAVILPMLSLIVFQINSLSRLLTDEKLSFIVHFPANVTIDASGLQNLCINRFALCALFILFFLLFFSLPEPLIIPLRPARARSPPAHRDQPTELVPVRWTPHIISTHSGLLPVFAPTPRPFLPP